MPEVLPSSVIEQHTSHISDDNHREHLRIQLGKLRHVETEGTIGEVETQTPDEQAELLGYYFGKASDELGPRADEDDVWKQVFKTQLYDLVESEGKPSEERLKIATNLLTGNLLSTYGFSEEYRKAVLDERMWEVVKSRHGLDIINAAGFHIDLCVSSGKEETPFISIKEQTEEFGALFMITDHAMNASEVAIPPKGIQSTTTENQAWFVDFALTHKNNDLTANIFAEMNNWDRNPIFCRVASMPNVEKETVTELARILADKDILTDFSNIPARYQSAIFEDLVAKNDIGKDTPQNIKNALSYFNKLEEKDLLTLIERRADFTTMFGYDFIPTSFDSISPEIAQKLFDAEFPIYAVMPVARAFDTDTQKKYFDKIVSDPLSSWGLSINLRSLTLDPEYVYDRLIANEQYDAIARNVDLFSHRDSITKSFSETHGGRMAILQNLDKFPDIDFETFLADISGPGDIYSASQQTQELLKRGVSPQRLFELFKADGSALMELTQQSQAVETIGRDVLFDAIVEADGYPYNARGLMESGLEHEFYEKYFDFCMAQDDPNALHDVVDDFPSKEELIKKCCAVGWEDPLLIDDSFGQYNRLLVGISKDQLEAWGAKSVFIVRAKDYPDVDIDKIYAQLFTENDPVKILKILHHDKVDSVPDSVAQYLIGTEAAGSLWTTKSMFNPGAFTPEIIEKYARDNHRGLQDIYEYSGQKIAWLDRGISVYGRDAPSPLYIAYRDITSLSDSDPIPEYLSELGINVRGRSGAEALKSYEHSVRKNLIRSLDPTHPDTKILLEQIRTNPLAKSIAQHIVRFKIAEWGETTNEAWDSIIQTYIDNETEPTILDPEFVTSKEYSIRSLSIDSFDPTKIDVDAADKFTLLRHSVIKALAIARTPSSQRYESSFSEARSQVQTQRQRLLASKEKLVGSGAKEVAIANIEKRLNEIDTFLGLSGRELIQKIQTDFGSILGLKIDGLDDTLRAVTFARAIRKSPNTKELAERLEHANLDYEGLSNMNELVDHVINQGEYQHYFKNNESYKSFKKISDSYALQLQLNKAQSGRAGDTSTLQIIPSKSLIHEFSGHIADACWASKYESIAKEFPHITTLHFIRDRGKPTERIVGSSLYIKTVDKDTGENIVVLRGINPIENYINTVKVEDFWSSYIDYATSISGDTPIAVVLDRVSGAATTNRPVISQFLNQTIRPIISQEPLSLDESSTFNGYVLSPQAGEPAYLIDPNA